MAAYEHLLKSYDIRDYEFFEHELIADRRIHYASACAKLNAAAELEHLASALVAA